MTDLTARQIDNMAEHYLNEKLPQDMTFEEILKHREVLAYAKEQMEAAMKVYSDELLIRLKEENISGKVVGNKSISKATRLSFKTTLDEARTLGAIKEAIDSEILKKLYYSKVNVPGVNITEYVMVKDVVKKEHDL